MSDSSLKFTAAYTNPDIFDTCGDSVYHAGLSIITQTHSHVHTGPYPGRGGFGGFDQTPPG